MRARSLSALVLSVGLAASVACAQEGPAKAPQAQPAPGAVPGSAPAADLPAAKEILAKYVDATGGRAAYEKQTNRVTKGSLEMPAMGLKGDYTLTQAAPDKYHMVMDLPGIGKIEQGSDGTTVWAMDPMGGARLLEKGERAQMRRSMVFNSELNPDKLWTKMETVGLEDIAGKPAYKLRLTPDDGKDTYSFYDKETGLLVKGRMTMNTQMGEMTSESTPSNYKEFDGIKFACTNVTQMGPQEMQMNVDKVEHNVQLAADAFDLPPEVKKLVEKRAAKKAEGATPKSEPTSPPTPEAQTPPVPKAPEPK